MGALTDLPEPIELPGETCHYLPETQDAPLRMAEVVSALSRALDLSTGASLGHSIRACIVGMRVAQEIRMPRALRGDLYYALLLKDAGCSGNSSKMFHALGSDDIQAKRDVKTTDWSRVSCETVQYALSHVAIGKPFAERIKALLRLVATQKRFSRDVVKIRCERGATLARLIGLAECTAQGIASLDEQWNGAGNPLGLRGREIPIFSRIMLLAQTLEAFFTSKGPEVAVEVVRERTGRWFDPDLVKAVESLNSRGLLWAGFEKTNDLSQALELDTQWKVMRPGDATLDAICLAFAQIVDAKSPFTFNHSNGVANAAVAIGGQLGLDSKRILFLRHAALLHDLGKLGVSNSILEKPGKLNDAEWRELRLHPYHTWKILNGVKGFAHMSEVAASHHEKLNGTGYFRGLAAPQLSLEARILVVADIFDALSAKRPYRDAIPLEKVFEIMRKDAPFAIDASCLEALERSGIGCDQTFVDLQTLSARINASSPVSAPVPSRSSVATLT